MLDARAAGVPAERALTNWARASRFAGSGDRAAVRDLVFDALRRLRSLAALGGAATGRGLMLGALRADGVAPDSLFDGSRHGPAPLDAAERRHMEAAVALDTLEALDCPDWLEPELRASLGADFAPVLEALRQRAPVFLRVNAARMTRAAAIGALAAEGIAAEPVPGLDWALAVTANARRLRGSDALARGLVEMQDASSQAVIETLPLVPGARVLDYCAGGGGKALAMAARGADVCAHDADPRRMADLPRRAKRAGATIRLCGPQGPAKAAPYGLVLADLPCSGSGSWRRSPEGKWTLDAGRLRDLVALQASILDAAAGLVAPRGLLAMATCSVLECENGRQVAAFLARNPDWICTGQHRWLPRPGGGDGFFLALLQRKLAGSRGD